MENIVVYLLLLIPITIILLIIVHTVSVFYHIFSYFFGFSGIAKTAFVRPNPKHQKILRKYFAYYNTLSYKEQVRFAKRVKVFIKLKKFIPRQMEKVSDEQKVLIAASAIQLTFGLTDVYFKSFSKILLYPDAYYSEIFQRYHKGEVNFGGGMIVLSWKNFLEGYINHKDGRNLGLHEMAHALRLENSITNEEYEFIDETVRIRWAELAAHEILKIRDGEPSFFREYAGTNREEFFAVAVENFFERPQKFHQYNAEMYDMLAQFLNQNPLERREQQGHRMKDLT